MTTHVIDNTPENYTRVVLWQHDKAYNLVRILGYFQTLFLASITTFWNFWVSGILDFDTCTGAGLTIWGDIIGVARPKISVTEGGVTSVRFVNDNTYRKLLKAAFYILKSDASLPSISNYTRQLFSVDTAYTGWTVNIPTLYVTVGWTGSVTSVTVDGETFWRMKIMDASGKVIGLQDADSDSLIINLNVYRSDYGEVAVKGERMHQCGLTLSSTLHMDLTYAPHATYFAMMDPDQQALYTQLGDEYLIFPLGVRYNHLYEQDAFGFAGQENTAIVFSSAKTYNKDDIVAHVDTDEYGNPERVFYRCTVTGTNGSWETVKANFVNTSDDNGGFYPYVGSFNGDNPTDGYVQYKAYAVGDMIYHPSSGAPLRCTSAITSSVNVNWAAAESHFVSMVYAPNVAYAVGTFVVGSADKMTYCCTSDLSAGENTGWAVAKTHFTLCWNDTIFRS